MTNPLVECNCGCGERMLKYDNRNRERRFLPGHYARFDKEGIARIVAYNHARIGKIGPWWKDDVKEGQSHYRARKLNTLNKCYINNEHCKGIIHTAHLDGNPFNNELDNLAKLCTSHHFLLDKRKLRLEQLTKIDWMYNIDKNGKRRYWKWSWILEKIVAWKGS